MKILGSLLAATLLLACTSDTPATPSTPPTPTPTPIAEVTAAPAPAPTTRATPGPSTIPDPVDRTRSLEAVQQVIAAVEDGNVDALEALIRYTRVPCDGEDSFVGPPYPACNGEPFSTAVDAFPAGVCGPVWHREPRPMLESFVREAGTFFAVIEGPEWNVDYGVPLDQPLSAGDYRVIFIAEPAGELIAYVAVVEDAALTALRLGCDTPTTALFNYREPAPPIIETGPAFVAPTPFPELTPFPDPSLASRSNRTGLIEVDRVLAAIESGDSTQIRSLLRYTQQQCTYAPRIGSALCENGELEAAVVNVFLHTYCEGAWSREDLDETARDLAGWKSSLFAVAGPTLYNDWYRLMFTDGPSNARGGVMLYVQNGHIVGIGHGCSASPEEWAKYEYIILRGPAWPEDIP